MRKNHKNIDVEFIFGYDKEKEVGSMIIQFSIKNFTSFKDKVTLDISAVHAYKEHESNLIDLGLKDKFLKVVSIPDYSTKQLIS